MSWWQELAQIATSLGVIVALIGFLWQVRQSNKDRAFLIFLRIVDYYKDINQERRHKWKTIKETVRTKPQIATEIQDKTASIDYLLSRIRQAEPLYAIEHGLLEDEIRSLNLLDTLCEYASQEGQMALILKISYASEISYYQNRLSDIRAAYDSEKRFRLFSVPHDKNLKKFQVTDYFENPPRSSTEGISNPRGHLRA